MAVANRLDPEQARIGLQRWEDAQRADAGAVRVSDVTIPKSTGMSNETVAFTLASDGAGADRRARLVARVHPRGAGLFPDYDIAREERIMRALAERSPLPVPRVRGRETDSAFLGAPFLVMDHVDGRAVADDPPHTVEGWVTELTPAQRATLHDNVLQRIAQLHELDPRALGLHDLPTVDAGDTPAARQLAYVTRYARHAAAGGPEDPTLAAARAWLREHCPPDDEPTVLCWGDARLANVLLADDLSVTAMLDWEEATLAPPAADIGYWLYSMRYYSEGLGLPLLPGFPTADETVARYEQLTGRPLEHREFYEVLAATRACCIVVRLMNLMVDAGLLPPDSGLRHNNPSTQLLARILKRPAPGGRPQEWAGLR
ncbi:MAG: putative phosphotransferase [Solirubrobacterales bacterium]|nr:putative phosphotransferase [Conexibacter sp.]MCW3014624.1 putative phosphotransferase [Solirubrobacterales bacterium]